MSKTKLRIMASSALFISGLFAQFDLYWVAASFIIFSFVAICLE
jgi:hypothetical protein